MWNGGNKEETEALVWSATPAAANDVALKVWNQFDQSAMDSKDNVDGARTKACARFVPLWRS